MLYVPYHMLINVKMQTIVGILTFMSMINSMLILVNLKKLITSMQGKIRTKLTIPAVLLQHLLLVYTKYEISH